MEEDEAEVSGAALVAEESAMRYTAASSSSSLDAAEDSFHLINPLSPHQSDVSANRTAGVAGTRDRAKTSVGATSIRQGMESTFGHQLVACERCTDGDGKGIFDCLRRSHCPRLSVLRGREEDSSILRDCKAFLVPGQRQENFAGQSSREGGGTMEDLALTPENLNLRQGRSTLC